LALAVVSSENVPPIPFVERSISKPVSLPELSVHPRLTEYADGASAIRAVGAVGTVRAPPVLKGAPGTQSGPFPIAVPSIKEPFRPPVTEFAVAVPVPSFIPVLFWQHSIS
jgi:hypothetical protein